MEVYVLLADGDGTMRSHDTPFGVAVTSEEEAKRFVEEGGIGYSHSYEKLTIFDNKDDANKFAFPEYKRSESLEVRTPDEKHDLYEYLTEYCEKSLNIPKKKWSFVVEDGEFDEELENLKNES